jgi:hypothetical protein
MVPNVIKSSAVPNGDSASSGLKRRRGSGVTNLHIPPKYSRTSYQQVLSGNAVGRASSYLDLTEGAGTAYADPDKDYINPVKEYILRHPVTKPVPAEDRELYCLCLQPEDGKAKIECANGRACQLRWYHLECIGMTEDLLPNEDGMHLLPSTRSYLTYNRRMVLFQMH